MESGRFILAIALMIAVVVLVNVVFPPPRPATRTPSPAPGDSTTPVPNAPSATTPPSLVPTPPVQLEAPIQAGPALAVRTDTIFVETPLYRFGFSTRGAGLVSAELLNFKSFTRDGRVQLVPERVPGLLLHRVKFSDRTVDLSQEMFTADRTTDLEVATGSSAASLRFTRADSDGGTVEITYTFAPDSYVMGVATRMTNAPAAQLLIDIGPTLRINEARAVEDERALAYAINSRRDGVRSVNLDKIREGSRIEEGPLDWVALKNKYFLVAAMPVETGPTAGFGGLVATDVPIQHAAALTATLQTSQTGEATYQVYIGPQEYDRLVAMGRQLEDVNPYGWQWLRPVIRPMGHAFSWMLINAHRATGLAYGWILILFGVAVRIALWPLNAKAMRSQIKNMELQPRMKEIQTRYSKDPERLQKEMIKLYKEEGFSPLGGCLPMLIPMPVLITLFFVFQSTIEFRGVSWLWLPDLSLADPLYILPVMLGVTMFIQQWMSLKNSPPNPQMKMMMWMMPGLMTFLFLNFASGLNLYYLAQNFASFPQQMMLIKERQRHQAAQGTLTPART